jgi:hypothetical protein
MNAESHGLGLSICREISKSLNGSLTFSSQPGEGSKFIFELEVEHADGLAERADGNGTNPKSDSSSSSSIDQEHSKQPSHVRAPPIIQILQ